MPRSTTTPRSQPMSSYPLYFSLVFHRSQVPISVATKRLAQPRSLPSLRPQPRHPSSPVGYVSFPQTVTGQLPVIFTAHTPWQPEGNYIRRTIFHHQFSLVCTLIPHPFLFQPPWPLSSPFYLTLGHVIFQSGLLFVRNPSSIKAALSLYYTSVLISTKIMTIFSLWAPQ